LKFIEIIQHMVNVGILIAIYSMSNKNFHYFLKKRASAQNAQRPTRKETYTTPPKRSEIKPLPSVKALYFLDGCYI
jgi:hypothetical protein